MRVRRSPRLLIACLAVCIAAAVAAMPRFRFDLPPAPLTTGVAQIGAMAGVSVATTDPAPLNKTGRAIRLEGTVPGMMMLALTMRRRVLTHIAHVRQSH